MRQEDMIAIRAIINIMLWTVCMSLLLLGPWMLRVQGMRGLSVCCRRGFAVVQSSSSPHYQALLGRSVKLPEAKICAKIQKEKLQWICQAAAPGQPSPATSSSPDVALPSKPHHSHSVVGGSDVGHYHVSAPKAHHVFAQLLPNLATGTLSVSSADEAEPFLPDPEATTEFHPIVADSLVSSSFLFDMDANPRIASFLVYGSFCHEMVQTYLRRIKILSTENPPQVPLNDSFIPIALMNATDYRAFSQRYSDILNRSLIVNFMAELNGRGRALDTQSTITERMFNNLKRYPFNQLNLEANEINVMLTLCNLLQQYIAYLQHLRYVRSDQLSVSTQNYLDITLAAFCKTLARSKGFFYFFHKPLLSQLSTLPTYEKGSLLSMSFLMDSARSYSHEHSSAYFTEAEYLRAILADRYDLLDALARVEFVRRTLIDYLLPGQLGEAFLFNAGQSPSTPIDEMFASFPAFQSLAFGSRRGRIDLILALEGYMKYELKNETYLIPEFFKAKMAKKYGGKVDKPKDDAATLVRNHAYAMYSLTALLDLQVQALMNSIPVTSNPPAVSPESLPNNVDLGWDVYRYLDQIQTDVADILDMISPLPADPITLPAAKKRRDRMSVYVLDTILSNAPDGDEAGVTSV